MIQTIENIALAALSSVETCRSTYAVCRQTLEEGIPGDFVECGVYAGSQAAIMARALLDHHAANVNPPFMRTLMRRVHLFDSFEGIPEPSSRDEEYIAAGHKKGTAACTLEGVKSNMKQWGIPDELLVYHVGWFAESVPRWMDAREYAENLGVAFDEKITRLPGIAVLRLDADLYDSTTTCMEHLYPLLSPGGFLIVDDYGLTGARQAVNDYMLSKGGGFGPVYMRRP